MSDSVNSTIKNILIVKPRNILVNFINSFLYEKAITSEYIKNLILIVSYDIVLFIIGTICLRSNPGFFHSIIIYPLASFGFYSIINSLDESSDTKIKREFNESL